MKKIITAINNPKLNEELAKENNFEIICKDIQYREAILEILEQNKNINIIIISEQILGEINFEDLIKKIKIINEKIKIIFILEKENDYLETILIKNNVNEIYYNDKINLFELIKIIKKKEINMEEEIIKLKKIIKEKENNYNKLKEDISKNVKKKNNKENNGNVDRKELVDNKEEKKQKEIPKKGNINNKNIKIMLSKIITFSGDYKTGKTTLSLITSQYLSNKNYKILLIDGDIKKQELSFILKSENKVNIKENKNKNKSQKIYYEKKHKDKKFSKNYFKNQKDKIKRIINLKDKIKKFNRNKSNNLKNKKIKIKKFKIFEIKKIYYKKIYKIADEIKIHIKKINNNFYFFEGLNNFLEKNSENNNTKKRAKIIKLLNIITKKYDFIIIDLSKENIDIINKEILRKGYKNFVLMEGNIIGIKEIRHLLYIYLKRWKINKRSLHIIENKRDMFSINTTVVSKTLQIKNKILKVRENKKFLILMNNYYKRNILLKNKNIKKDINKIIKIVEERKRYGNK